MGKKCKSDTGVGAFDLAKEPHRFHLLGLAHLPVSERYMACAFTQKIVKLSKMLLDLGHEVILYGAEGSDAPCTEFVETHTLDDIRWSWGDQSIRPGPFDDDLGYDWKKEGFRTDFNEPKTAATKKYYVSATNEILKRKQDDDFLLLSQGSYQKKIADEVKLFLTCEPGIGYRGSYAKYRAFESAYLQNFTYGSEHPRQSINGNPYDRVIPNYFDEKDFPFQAEKDDYYLFVGRLIPRKGLRIALLATDHLNANLVLAGQGDFDISEFKHAEKAGFLDATRRANLMGRAKAVFVPTLYLEPFGGVNIEAQLCGTPVICSNFGAFPETVIQGKTGFLCNTLEDYVLAAKQVHTLDPLVIREHAEQYLMNRVKYQFNRWFQDLYRLYLSAQPNSTAKGWHYLP